ncbi:MAG: HAMP domain-containing sensor histidine kinase [Gammaproteobacteria bacterium]|nr:HAMP domain-containing sensor histidine kinase [Gammaproteobacteria bacterium]
MSTDANFGIATQIKKRIGNRILTCLFLLFLVIIGFTVVDTIRSFQGLEKVINTECSFLSDFTISQVLINNQQAVNIKLSNYNQDNSYTITWVPKGHPSDNLEMVWEPPFSWHYNYSLQLNPGDNYGYFHVKGSALEDHALLSNLLDRIILMIVFIVLIFILLYPLAKKIPKQLFIDPIQDLLHLLKTGSQPNTANLPTEMIEIQNQITALLKEVTEKSKEAAFSELAAQVAHDIRSPLAALDVLVKHLSDVPENQRIILRNATTRINDIANNLLNEFKSRKLPQANSIKTKDTILVSAVIAGIISEKRLQYENSSIEFIAKIQPAAYFVLATFDINDLKRLLSNVMNNAAEAINGKGQVAVSLELLSGNNIKLSVQDNGHGIAEDKLAHIFTIGSFNKKGGSGLGLSHAKHCVEAAGGQITLSSQIDKGTTVNIILPRADKPKWFADKIVISPSTEIWIVDDDSSIHDAWNERFAHFTGLSIRHFDDPMKFTEWFQLNLHKNFFLLSDYEFINASLNGLDVISTVNSKNCILVTSHYEDKDIIQQCENLGIRLLPKNLSAYIPIKLIQEAAPVDMIFLDDNNTLTQAWEIAGASVNINVKTYNASELLLADIVNYPKDIAIYIDSDLRENVRGEDIAKQLYDMGYHELFLATGSEPENFAHCTWLKGIIGKIPPFKL